MNALNTSGAVRTGMVSAGLAAAVVVGLDQVSGGQTPPQPGSAQAPAQSQVQMPVPVQTRATFADATSLTVNRQEDGGYLGSVLLHNPHCKVETVTLTATLVDRKGVPIEVVLHKPAERGKVLELLGDLQIEAASFKAVPLRIDLVKQANTGSAQPVIGEPGAATTPASDKPVSAAPASTKDRVVAALGSKLPSYGEWGARLPGRGVLVLTRKTPTGASSTRTGCSTTAATPPTVRRDLVLDPPLPTGIDDGVLLAALGLAVAATLAGLAAVWLRGMALLSRMGGVAFDVGQSWGSNLAIGGAIVTALTSTTVLPRDQYSTQSTIYTLLAALFGAFVPLGAAMYALLRQNVAVGLTTQRQGFVVVYMLSSGLVLWGAFGQLLLVGMLVREIESARVLGESAADILIILMRLLIAALVVYATVAGPIAAQTSLGVRPPVVPPNAAGGNQPARLPDAVMM